MSHCNSRLGCSQLRLLRWRWSRTPGFLPDVVLPLAQVQAALQAEAVVFRDRLFTPLVTVYAFLGQILDPDHSCRQAVARVLAWLVGCGRKACSAETGAYCKARQRLPENVLIRLTRDTGQQLATKHRRRWHWHGHVVKVLDGSSANAPDTCANQKAYPQHGQAAGLGFPLIRMVVLFSLAVGTVLDAAYGPYRGKQTAETALWRTLRHNLEPDDILLADHYHGSFWEVAAALQRGAHAVLRVHQRRKVDFRRGQRLGHDDHMVTWSKPQRPDWMDEASYAALPEQLTVRELRYGVTTPGFRTRELVIATTLLDAEPYAAAALADLYHQRWHVELDIRAIKISLKIDQLRCRTPFMLEKELWAHFLAYNLMRKVSAQTAQTRGIHPRTVSFTGTKDAVAAAWGQWTAVASAAQRLRQSQALLHSLGTERVGQRPDRCEPRVVKRRPKQYKHLRQPRAQARAKLLQTKR